MPRLLTLVVVPTLLALVSCADPTGPSTDTDGSGAPVTVNGPVSRVVCLTGICDDALLELGLEPVASREAGAHDLLAQPAFLGPDAAAKIPTIGGGFGEENVEDVIKARPELVIGLAGVHDGLRPAVESAAPLYLAKVTKYQDSIDFLTWMGEITGRTHQAAAAVERFQTKIAAARANPSPLTSLSLAGVDANFDVSTESSLLGSILGLVGKYPWQETAGGSHEPGTATYSLEEILRTDPDVIFVSTIQVTAEPPTPISYALADNPVWGRLKAVRSGQVVDTDALFWITGRGTRSLGIVLDQAQQELAHARTGA
ncbi:ABC transporter substrate-binding protein [Pseudonocardia sp. CA-107938]|uniref:ABC transporter substrate-binding protein n=1 Tax=Pseudonocardia sp. CA-107938 TaxID=3240021 RepID=UPI003D8AE0F3